MSMLNITLWEACDHCGPRVELVVGKMNRFGIQEDTAITVIMNLDCTMIIKSKHDDSQPLCGSLDTPMVWLPMVYTSGGQKWQLGQEQSRCSSHSAAPCKAQVDIAQTGAPWFRPRLWQGCSKGCKAAGFVESQILWLRFCCHNATMSLPLCLEVFIWCISYPY